MLSGFGQMIVNVTDTVFLGRLNEVALGASAIGGLLLASFLMISYGFSTGMQIVIARKDGEGNRSEIGNVFWQSAYFKLFLSLMIVVVFLPFAPVFLETFVTSRTVLAACVTFITIRLLGLPFAYAISLFRGYYSGIGQTKIISIAIGSFAVLNVFLNYLLVFGNWGFPRLEIAGSAIASVISEIVGALVFLVYTLYSKSSKEFGLNIRPPYSWEVLSEVLEISLPMMMQFFLAVGSWFAFFLIVENLGERSLAISNLVRNVYMLLMIPIIAFSNTTNTVVSNLVGQNKINEIIPTLKIILPMNLGFTLILVFLNLLNPSILLGIYTNLDAVINDSITTIYIISGSIFFFALANCCLSTVSGLGKTNVALGIEALTLVCYFLYTWLAVYVFHWSLEAVWCNEYVYFISMLIISMLYLWRYFSKSLVHQNETSLPSA